MDETDGYAELISDAANGKLLGAVIAAPHASELISILTVALQAEMTIEQLKKIVFPPSDFK